MEELEIKAILNNHLADGQHQYLLCFKGYSKHYDTWVNHKDINTNKLLPHYKQGHKACAAGQVQQVLGLQGGM